MSVLHFLRRLAFLCCAAWASSACAQSVVGEVFSADANLRGAVVLTAGGTQVLSGSSITAGSSAARLKLARGGEVRVCPGTQLGVNASASGRELMLSLNSGSLEAHYSLSSNADSIVTPDFRLLLAGPGEFHIALASDVKGNTCVRALAGTSASIIVTEQTGDGVYQLRPGEEVVFRAGTVRSPQAVDVPCGCPPPPELKIAEVKPKPEPPKTEDEPPPADIGAGLSPLPALPAPQPTAPAAEPPPQPVTSAPVHVQVDAPFVFRADELPDPMMFASVRLHRASAQNMWPTVAPPPQPPPPELARAPLAAPEKPRKKKRNWFKAFFAALFR